MQNSIPTTIQPVELDASSSLSCQIKQLSLCTTSSENLEEMQRDFLEKMQFWNNPFCKNTFMVAFLVQCPK